MQFAQKSLGSFVRYLLVAVAMVSVMPVLSLFTGTALAAPGVTIPDDNLRAALERALRKGEGAPITEAELAGLTEFTATDKSITDLTGIEFCTNLQDLRINHNTISDISALASLTDLQELSLSGNSISDISALAGLTKLRGLRLKGNELNSAAYATHIPALEANGTVVI